MGDWRPLISRSDAAARSRPTDNSPAQRSALGPDGGREADARPRPLRVGEFRHGILGVYQVLAITPTDVKVRYADGRDAHLSFKVAHHSSPGPQCADEAAKQSPLRAGALCADSRGVYEVLAVFPPRMRIHYRTGEAAMVDIATQLEACRRVTARAVTQRERAAQRAVWFRVGESYHDHRGGYSVLSIDYPAMTVQYESGDRARVDMSRQWRVHEVLAQDLARRRALREGQLGDRARAPHVRVCPGGLPKLGGR